MKNVGRMLKRATTRRWRRASSASQSIVRTIHIVWIGDEGKRPNREIESWREKNPGWTVRIWGNRELTSIEWENHKHLSAMLNRQEWRGVADMMRWEILDKHGGFAVDANSINIRPLEDWLFEPGIFACWENEIARPELVSNLYVYARPGNELIQQVIQDIYDLPDVSGPAHLLTGPSRFTDTFRAMRYADLTIYPSHYFIPTHLTGLKYQGKGPVFSEQLWAELQMEQRIGRLPDRLVMANSILPGVREIAREILWIGCRGYTRAYPSILEESGARCWTIDIDPGAAQFGHPVRHVIGDVNNLKDHFSPDTFDAILCNGVFGWGVNSVESQSRVLEEMAHILRPGGTLVLGWNTDKSQDPVELLQPNFEPADLFGLGKRVKFSGHTHVYDFCVSTKKQAS